MSYTASFGGTTLLALTYTRDAAGRITAIDTGTANCAFEYDDAGRLTRVTANGTPVAEYDNDANSNRTAHPFTGGANTATYDEQDRLPTY